MQVNLYLHNVDESDADIARINVTKDTDFATYYLRFQEQIAYYDKHGKWNYMNDEVTISLTRERLVDLRDKIDKILIGSESEVVGAVVEEPEVIKASE